MVAPFGKNGQSWEETRLCPSTEGGAGEHWDLSQKCTGDSKHSSSQERDMGQAEMFLLH